ncbi:SHOCT domain-containing protein [Paratractidigestivibacter sp.]|uniref:SHOCT domain-containing protein n=1 Tax=Paratractidigestivibacter sp. TaxID=2847316 RepID=UPI002ABDF2DC|nr:SHOCT domain-containing protein [Paratractidigestivibacter sp.]
MYGLEWIVLALLVCYIVAWVMAMQLIAKVAEHKGYRDITGKLWFIGFFGFAFTPAVIVSALPDKGAGSDTPTSEKIDAELAKYKELQEQGVITEEELQAKKDQLLKLV